MAPLSGTKKAKPKQSTLAFAAPRKPSPLSAVRASPLTKVVPPPATPSPAPESKGKQKALPAPKPRSTTTKPSKNTDDASSYYLWADKYGPTSREELAVHKQKVEEVTHWLSEAFGDTADGRLSKYRRILVLTGPSGVGKTATLRVLARAMNVHVVEWENAVDDWKIGDSGSYSQDRISLSRKFENFLARGSEYSALSFPSTSNAASTSTSSTWSSTRRLLLIDDIPNIQNASTRDAFHEALTQFVETPSETSCPIVIIVSEAGLRVDSSNNDTNSWYSRQQEAITFKTVLPKALQGSPAVANIAFNPIAPTLLKRGVSSVLTKHFSGTSSPFSKEFLDYVLKNANGDIRSALGTLQFAQRGSMGPAVGSRKKGDKAKREQVTSALIDSLSQREQSLELFHVLGKLLYNKRYGDNPKEDEEDPPPPILRSLPAHLKTHERAPSKVNLEMLYRDSPIDASMLALYTHQNIHLFANEIEELEVFSEVLSGTDELLVGESLHRLPPEYAFYLTSLGALHSLPVPVKRRNQKLTGAEYFDSLRRTRIAEEQISTTGDWMVQGLSLPRYAGAVIATEFTGVLSGLHNPPKNGGGVPRHEAFSVFGEIVRAPAVMTDAHEAAAGGAIEEEDEGSLRGAVRADGPAPGGWLSDDEIEDW